MKKISEIENRLDNANQKIEKLKKDTRFLVGNAYKFDRASDLIWEAIDLIHREKKYLRDF